MTLIVLYFATAIIFFACDMIGLRFVVKPIFERQVGHLFADEFRMLPAGVFYLGYVAGLVYLVSWTALKNDAPLMALLGGVILGLVAYGTYEFSNFATLRDWTAKLVTVDFIWGGVLTGFSAWAGVMVTRAIT